MRVLVCVYCGYTGCMYFRSFYSLAGFSREVGCGALVCMCGVWLCWLWASAPIFLARAILNFWHVPFLMLSCWVYFSGLILRQVVFSGLLKTFLVDSKMVSS
jgi:hypothetical protein